MIAISQIGMLLWFRHLETVGTFSGKQEELDVWDAGGQEGAGQEHFTILFLMSPVKAVKTSAAKKFFRNLISATVV